MKTLLTLSLSAALLSTVACSSDSATTSDPVAAFHTAVMTHCLPAGDNRPAKNIAYLQALPGYSWDKAELARCTEAVNAGNCDSVHCDLIYGTWGTLPVGAACNEDGQCASARCSSAGGCGVCQAETCPSPCTGGQVCNDGVCGPRPTLAAAGASCKNSLCDDGLTCKGDICVASPKVGEACAGSSRGACVAGAICQAGKCAARVAEGGSCGNGYVCAATLLCGDDNRCRKAKTVALGEACVFGDICSGGVCASGAQGGRTCRAMDKAGDACTYTSCEGALICGNNDTCTTAAAAVCK